MPTFLRSLLSITITFSGAELICDWGSAQYRRPQHRGQHGTRGAPVRGRSIRVVLSLISAGPSHPSSLGWQVMDRIRQDLAELHGVIPRTHPTAIRFKVRHQGQNAKEINGVISEG